MEMNTEFFETMGEPERFLVDDILLGVVERPVKLAEEAWSDIVEELDLETLYEAS